MLEVDVYEVKLDDSRIRALRVVEANEAVIDWHERRLMPIGKALTADARCAFVHGDFFAMADGFGPGALHAILVDIDHTPEHLLHSSHSGFYTAAGLTRLRRSLHPDGVFGLWSAAPDSTFVALLRSVFSSTPTPTSSASRIRTPCRVGQYGLSRHHLSDEFRHRVRSNWAQHHLTKESH